jgi:O-antigen ligase
MLLLGAYFFQSGVIQRRFSENYGATPRQQLWSAHLEGFRSNPVLGVGFRKTTEYLAQLNRSGKVDLSKSIISHPHSNYFEFLVGTGILGISVLFIWIGYTGYLAYQLEEKGLFCAWIVFWLNGLTQVNLLEGKVIHQAMLMVGVSLGAWLIHGKNPKSLFSKY